MKYILALIFLLSMVESASSEIFEWDYDVTPELMGFNIYRSQQSLTCEEMFNVANPYAQMFTIPEAQIVRDYYYYVITAYSATEEAEYSNELLRKFCDGVQCQSDVNVQVQGNTATIIWEAIPGVTGYQIRMTKDGQTSTYDQVGNSMSVELDPGQWNIQIFAKDSLGRTIELGNTYDEQNIEVFELPPPPAPPAFKVESFGATALQTLMIAFNSTNEEIDHYLVNIYSNSAEAIAGGIGDLLPNIQIPRGSNLCEPFDVELYYDDIVKKYKLTYQIFFFTVASVDIYGQTGERVMGYQLIGNIVGTANPVVGVSYEGIPFNEAIVNTQDYNAYKLYYYKPVVHSSTNYCDDVNLYTKLPFTYSQRTDYNLDGIVNAAELNFFKLVLGNTGAGK